MGPELDSKETTEVFAGKKREATKDTEDTPMQCVDNLEGSTFDVEEVCNRQNNLQSASQDAEVDVTERTDSYSISVDEVEKETESTSSFGNAESFMQNDSFSDSEVESRLSERYTMDSYGRIFPLRRKNVTAHWRRYIHPLMWRCKWMELKIKEMQSLALKYDRKLAEYDKRKQMNFEKSTFDDFDAKSQPFPSHTPRKKIMKRKKRTRVEETVDIESYKLQHNLFSYYVTKEPDTYLPSMDHACGNSKETVNPNNNFGFDGWTCLDFGEPNNTLETILRQVEMVHSKVCHFKCRIDKVLSEIPRKVRSINDLSLPSPENGNRIDKVLSEIPRKFRSINDMSLTSPENGNRIDGNSSSIFPEHSSKCSIEDLMPGGTFLRARKSQDRVFFKNIEEAPLIPIEEHAVAAPAPAPGDVIALETSVSADETIVTIPDLKFSGSNKRQRRLKRIYGWGKGFEGLLG